MTEIAEQSVSVAVRVTAEVWERLLLPITSKVLAAGMSVLGKTGNAAGKLTLEGAAGVYNKLQDLGGSGSLSVLRKSGDDVCMVDVKPELIEDFKAYLKKQKVDLAVRYDRIHNDYDVYFTAPNRQLVEQALQKCAAHYAAGQDINEQTSDINLENISYEEVINTPACSKLLSDMEVAEIEANGGVVLLLDNKIDEFADIDAFSDKTTFVEMPEGLSIDGKDVGGCKFTVGEYQVTQDKQQVCFRAYNTGEKSSITLLDNDGKEVMRVSPEKLKDTYGKKVPQKKSVEPKRTISTRIKETKAYADKANSKLAARALTPTKHKGLSK